MISLNYHEDIKPHILNKKGHINGHKLKPETLAIQHPEWIEWFNSLYEPDMSIQEKVYCLEHNLKERKVCPACGNPCKFKSIETGYQKYCSKECRWSEYGKREAEKLQKETNMEKYGVEHTFQSINNKEKSKLTNLKRYGATHPTQSEKVKQKIKLTVQDKYGADSYFKSEDFKNKTKSTNLEKYGIETPQSSDIVKEKQKNTFKKKYNVTTPLILDIVKEKQKEAYKEKARKNNEEKGYIIEYIDNDKIIVKNACPVHGDIEIELTNYWNRIKPERISVAPLCPLCNPIGSANSGLEVSIEKFLQEHNINYIRHDRKILKGQELDFYIPDKNLAIECNGVYWHSEIFKQKPYHQEKSKLCRKQNIQLLHIWEDDFLCKKNIILDLLKTKLGIIEKRIGARECEIKEVSSTDSRKFLTEYHIQGNVNASIRYGLYYDKELVALMTFGNLRISTGQKPSKGNYELYRYAVKSGYIIQGGASRLLKYFQKHNNWKSILSYAKFDYSSGNVYKQLGFKCKGLSAPNYFWVSKQLNIRENRYKYRKSEISDEYTKNLTEADIMHEKGFYRCYDSGNLKYEMINPENKY